MEPTPQTDHKQSTIAALVLLAATGLRVGSNPAANSAAATSERSHLTVELVATMALQSDMHRVAR